MATSMADRFIPKMSYTYTYRSAQKYRSPIVWSCSLKKEFHRWIENNIYVSVIEMKQVI